MDTNNFSKLEEQLLNNIKQTEDKLSSKINEQNLEIYENINDIQTKINNLIVKNEALIETLAKQKIYMDKITEFEVFKTKTDEILLAHEIKLKNSGYEIFSLKDKYEKIVLENLTVPGYIGPSSQFKNLSEYLTYSINILNRVRSEKDNGKKDMTDLKSKYDNLMKTIINFNDHSFERCKEYVNTIQNDIINIVDNKLKDYKDNYFEIKQEIYKYNSEHNRQLNQIELKTKDVKKELNDLLQKKINEIKIDNDLLKNDIDICSNNIQENSFNLETVNKDIKDLKRKLNDLFIKFKNSQVSMNPPQFPTKMKDIKVINKRNMLKLKSNNEEKIINNEVTNNFGIIKVENLNNIIKSNITMKKNGNKSNSFEKDIENDINPYQQEIIDKTDMNVINFLNDNINNNITLEKLKSKLMRKNNQKGNNFSYNNGYNTLYEPNKRNLKFKSLSGDLNKYLKKDILTMNSSLKDKNTLKTPTIINKYKTIKHNNEQTMKLFDNTQYNKYKTKTDLIQDNSDKEKPKRKIKLNNEIINQINNNKVLDLYSFSVSPPEGKIDLNINYFTINDNIQKKCLQEKNQISNEIGGNVNKTIQIFVNDDKNKKIKPNNSQSIIKNREIQSMKTKYQNNYRISSERSNKETINNNDNIILIPPKYNLPFNNTFIESDNYKEKNTINIENFKLRNSLKNLKLKDSKICLTGK